MTHRIQHLILVALLALALPAGAAAQSSEDTSGADQYTEQGIPGAEEDTSDEPAETDPAPTPAPAPSGSSGSTATPTADTAQATDTTGLPRTGAEAGWLALVAAAFLGAGLLLRRALPHQSG